MHLIYLDESGNTGNNLVDPQQPVFVLGALIVPEEKWRAIEAEISTIVADYFQGPPPENFEIHATDIRNGTQEFRGTPVEERIALRDDLLALANRFELRLVYRAIVKKRYASWLDKTFGAGITINPHIAAFPLVAQTLNHYLRNLGEDALGILINDDNKDVVADLERTTKLLRSNDGTLQLDRIIEKSFFIDSSKSSLLQLADLCIFHARKLEEIKIGLPERRLDSNGIRLIEPLIHQGNEALPDVLAWLTDQKKRSGEGPSGTGSPRGGRSRR